MKSFNKLLILISVIAITNTVSAQKNYTISPSKVLTGQAVANTTTAFDIYMLNTSSQSITLKWKKISANMVSTWDFSLCDYGACKPGIPDSGKMSAVSPNVEGFLALNINPFADNGTSTVKMLVWDASKPINEGDTLTWIITLAPTGINTITLHNHELLYPNPATDWISLDNTTNMTPKTFELYDLNGRLMTKENGYTANNRIYVGNLSAGIYQAKITTGNGQSVFQKIIKTNQ